MSPAPPSPSVLRYLAACLRSPTFQSKNLVHVRQICHFTRPEPRTAARSCLYSVQPRTYSTNTKCQAEATATGNHGKARIKVAKDAVEKEFILDEDIPAGQVRLKDSETGKLLGPQSLFSLLRSIDRDVQVVRALATPPDEAAIVEITTREVLLDRIKRKELQAANIERVKRDSKPKQIELNWAISSNDLDLKMKQLRQFVEKGKKVELLLAAKKKQRKATPEEANNVVQEIRKTITEIEGCRELKPLDGNIGGQVLMTVGKQKG